MAPPSFPEFVQALLVREAVAALCPSLSGSVHLGNKGCLLDREWLGEPTDPRSPAGVMANLRYDLFTAKGLRETPMEAFLSALRVEGAKQIVTVLGLVLAGALLFFLGIKTGGR